MMMILQCKLLAFHSRIPDKLFFFCFETEDAFCQKVMMGSKLQGTPFQNFTRCCILLIWEFANDT